MGRSSGVVVVCGAGAAGLSAALAAARAGAEVCLLEARPRLGGTVAHALIHTLGGLYDSAGELLNAGLPEELARSLIAGGARRRRIGRAWVLSACPNEYQNVVEGWVAAEPQIAVFPSTRVDGVVKEGDRVVEVGAAGPRGKLRLRARSIIDATGTAAVVRSMGPSLVQEVGEQAAGGLVFTLRGVVPGSAAFPRGLGLVRALHRAAEDGALPTGCRNAWLDVGATEDEVYVKLSVPLSPGWDEGKAMGEAPREALEAQAAALPFLQRLSGFADARIHRTGELGVRDGGRARGDYCLALSDVRQARKFEDAACRCCWPVEYWGPDGAVSLEYLPDGTYYEIPLRSLKVRGLRNVWVAGKCLSADRLAQASARVVGTCWAMGEAAGKAAARGGPSDHEP